MKELLQRITIGIAQEVVGRLMMVGLLAVILVVGSWFAYRQITKPYRQLKNGVQNIGNTVTGATERLTDGVVDGALQELGDGYSAAKDAISSLDVEQGKSIVDGVADKAKGILDVFGDE